MLYVSMGWTARLHAYSIIRVVSSHLRYSAKILLTIFPATENSDAAPDPAPGSQSYAAFFPLLTKCKNPAPTTAIKIMRFRPRLRLCDTCFDSQPKSSSCLFVLLIFQRTMFFLPLKNFFLYFSSKQIRLKIVFLSFFF
jgi:hypothetical protein